MPKVDQTPPKTLCLIGAAAFALASCGGEDASAPSPAPPSVAMPPPTPSPTSALAYAATFPEMPRETLELRQLAGVSDPTFGSGVPFNDLAYTMIDTDFIEGETAGFDTFYPVDPSSSTPGADRIMMVRGVNNVDINLAYDAQDGDRIILGTAEIAQPFFLRGADGVDNDYAVISAFDYESGFIQLKGTASDYELVFCDTADGCNTSGYYLMHTGGSELDLVAFIFPCDDVPIPVSGNSPNNPESLCNSSQTLSLTNTAQFRFAQPLSQSITVPNALTQFGTEGKEIVGGQAVDAAGNIYVLGQTDGNFASGASGGNRILAAQVRPDGLRGWTYQLDLPNGALIFDGVADAQHLYLAGRTHGALPGFTSGGAWDGFIIKLRLSDGVQVASNQFGNRGLDGYGNIILDDAGNLFVSGQGSPASATGTDPFHLVAKHRSDDLSAVWQNFMEPPTTGVLVSEAWGGLFYRPGVSAGTGTLTSAGWLFGDGSGLSGAWIELYGSLNADIPVRQAGTILSSPQAQADWILDHARDAAGNIYAVGFTTGNLSGQHRGNGDAFIAKYDASMNLIDIVQLGTPLADSFRKLTISSAGVLYAVGYSYGDMAGNNADPANETGDVIVYAFDASLNTLASQQFGSPHEDRGYVDVTASQVIVAGMTEASLGGPSAGSFDAFVVRLNRTTLAIE